MYGSRLPHPQSLALKFADADVLYIRQLAVIFDQMLFVGVMQRINERRLHELGKAQARGVVQVNHVSFRRSVFHRPGRMAQAFQIRFRIAGDRPVLLLITPFLGDIHGRFTVGVNHHLRALLLQAFSQFGDEKLGTAVLPGRH